MSKVIMVANQKGGAGKTSSCVDIGFLLAKKGYKTLFIDLDAQCNLTDAVGYDYDDDPNNRDTIFSYVLDMRTYDECVKKLRPDLDLYLIPGSRKMLSQYFVGDGDVYFLRDKISELVEKGNFDFILIDVGPEGGNLMTMAFLASDYVIAVAHLAKHSYQGVMQMIKDIGQGKSKYINFNVKPLGLLITESKKTIIGDYNRDRFIEASELFAPLFATEISHSAKMDECKEFGVPIHEYQPKSKLAAQYRAVTEEILERITSDGTTI